jgi:hypothetical protein
MANTTTATCLPLFPSLEMAWRDVDSSFERFCLTAGIEAVEQMLREDAQQLTGAPHRRGGGRVGHRWGTPEGKSRTRDLGKRAAGWLSTSDRRIGAAALAVMHTTLPKRDCARVCSVPALSVVFLFAQGNRSTGSAGRVCGSKSKCRGFWPLVSGQEDW